MQRVGWECESIFTFLRKWSRNERRVSPTQQRIPSLRNQRAVRYCFPGELADDRQPTDEDSRASANLRD